jgi:hypothetical protein
VRKGKKRAWWATMESPNRERAFLYQVPSLWEGRPRRFPPNNEWVGRGMGSSQPGEGGLAIPRQPTWATNFSYFLPASNRCFKRCLNCFCWKVPRVHKLTKTKRSYLCLYFLFVFV